MYKVYVYMTFYPRLNPDIVPIIRFWDSPNIVVTIYVCRMYSTFFTQIVKVTICTCVAFVLHFQTSK